MAGCPLAEEETKRVILHTRDHMLCFTHPTGIVESNLITVMLKMKMHTLRMGRAHVK